MTVVSYRIYCGECGEDEVIREDMFEESLWNIKSKHNHNGLCPRCNPAVNSDEIESRRESREDDDEPVPFEEVSGLGESTAAALRRAGLRSKGDVRFASDAKLLEVSGVGQSKVDSLREYVG